MPQHPSITSIRPRTSAQRPATALNSAIMYIFRSFKLAGSSRTNIQLLLLGLGFLMHVLIILIPVQGLGVSRTEQATSAAQLRCCIDASPSGCSSSHMLRNVVLVAAVHVRANRMRGSSFKP